MPRATALPLHLVDANRSYAQVLAESVNGSLDVAYHYGDDLISQSRIGSVRYFHVDGLGSTRVLTDSSGSQTDGYAYAAFGEVLVQDGVTDNSYLYTGEQYDANLDQYYLRARYYDQGVGRFTQMDAWTGRVGNPVTLQKYLYGNVDPVLMTDPSGQFSIGLALSPISTSSRLSYSVGSSAVRFGSNAFGTAARATFSGGRVVGAVLRKEIRNCTASKGNRCRLPNIVVVGSNISAAQDHISAAQTGRGNYKDGVGRSPTRLTYLPRSK